jgi:hypothetical protein
VMDHRPSAAPVRVAQGNPLPDAPARSILINKMRPFG